MTANGPVLLSHRNDGSISSNAIWKSIQRRLVCCDGHIDLSHTSAILDLKLGSVGYKVVTTQPWIWVTVVLPHCKRIYRGIHLSHLSFNQTPNQERNTERYHAWLTKFRSNPGPHYHFFDREVQLSIAGSINHNFLCG